MRARYPDREGYAERDGVRLFFEVYEGDGPTFLLLPITPFAYSRGWKGQIPYLARHFRVVAYDGRGSGRSDRPTGVDAFHADELARDALAVMDATGTEKAVLVGQSVLTRVELWLAAEHPERVAGAVFITPYIPLTKWPPVDTMWRTWDEHRAWRRGLSVIWGTTKALFTLWIAGRDLARSYLKFTRAVRFFEGVTKFNSHYWLEHQRSAVEYINSVLDYTEPHSTWQIEQGVGWAMETDPQTFVDAFRAIEMVDRVGLMKRDSILRYTGRVECPCLVIHGKEDVSVPPRWGRELAEATGADLLLLEQTAHIPQGRKPVAVNLALREFGESLLPAEVPARDEVAAA